MSITRLDDLRNTVYWPISGHLFPSQPERSRSAFNNVGGTKGRGTGSCGTLIRSYMAIKGWFGFTEDTCERDAVRKPAKE